MVTNFGGCLCCDSGICDVCGNDNYIDWLIDIRPIGSWPNASGEYSVQLRTPDVTQWKDTFTYNTGASFCKTDRFFDSSTLATEDDTVCDFSNSNITLTPQGTHTIGGHKIGTQLAQTGFFVCGTEIMEPGIMNGNFSSTYPNSIIITLDGVQNSGSCSGCTELNRDYTALLNIADGRFILFPPIPITKYSVNCQSYPCPESYCEEAADFRMVDADGGNFPTQLMVTIDNVTDGSEDCFDCSNVNTDTVIDLMTQLDANSKPVSECTWGATDHHNGGAICPSGSGGFNNVYPGSIAGV